MSNPVTNITSVNPIKDEVTTSMEEIKVAATIIEATKESAVEPKVEPQTTTKVVQMEKSIPNEKLLGIAQGGVKTLVDPLVLTPIDNYNARKVNNLGGEKSTVKELLKNPYKGIVFSIVSGGPSQIAFFAAIPIAREMTQSNISNKDLATAASLVVATAVGNGVGTPVSTVKKRLQKKEYNSVREVLGAIPRNELLGTLYRGYSWIFVRDMTSNVVMFITADKIKEFLEQDSKEVSQRQQVGNSLVGGFTAGVLSSSISYPFDVIATKKKLQTEKMSGFTIARDIVKTEGVKALWTGYEVIPLRQGLQAGLTIATMTGLKFIAENYMNSKGSESATEAEEKNPQSFDEKLVDAVHTVTPETPVIIIEGEASLDDPIFETVANLFQKQETEEMDLPPVMTLQSPSGNSFISTSQMKIPNPVSKETVEAAQTLGLIPSQETLKTIQKLEAIPSQETLKNIQKLGVVPNTDTLLKASKTMSFPTFKPRKQEVKVKQEPKKDLAQKFDSFTKKESIRSPF